MVKKVYEPEDLVEGIAYYFNPQKRSEFNGITGKYEITLGISKKDADAIKKAGGNVVKNKKVGTDDDGNPIELEYVIKPKSDYPIHVRDAAADSLDNAIKHGLKIGNGSKVAADIFVYEGKMNNGIGINGVQVLELVEYASKGSNKFTKRGEGIAKKYEEQFSESQDDENGMQDDEIPY